MQDEAGYFHFAARSDDMIISAGYNIAGPEVEAALLAHPDVRECAVIDIPDVDRGQIVQAHVVLDDGIAARHGHGRTTGSVNHAHSFQPDQHFHGIPVGKVPPAQRGIHAELLDQEARRRDQRRHFFVTAPPDLPGSRALLQRLETFAQMTSGPPVPVRSSAPPVPVMVQPDAPAVGPAESTSNPSESAASERSTANLLRRMVFLLVQRRVRT